LFFALLVLLSSNCAVLLRFSQAVLLDLLMLFRCLLHALFYCVVFIVLLIYIVLLLCLVLLFCLFICLSCGCAAVFTLGLLYFLVAVVSEMSREIGLVFFALSSPDAPASK